MLHVGVGDVDAAHGCGSACRMTSLAPLPSASTYLSKLLFLPQSCSVSRCRSRRRTFVTTAPPGPGLGPGIMHDPLTRHVSSISHRMKPFPPGFRRERPKPREGTPTTRLRPWGVHTLPSPTTPTRPADSLPHLSHGPSYLPPQAHGLGSCAHLALARLGRVRPGPRQALHAPRPSSLTS